VIGELRVRYSVTFDVPILETTAAAPTNNQVAWLQSSAPEALVNTVPKTLALATTSTNGLLAVNTAGSIVLPAGNYLADWTAVFTDLTNETVLAQIKLEVAGVSINTTAIEFADAVAIGAGQTISLSGSGFVSLNGIQALTLVALMNGAAGTLTAAGTLRLTAI
jgi:hypothetical protein